MYAHRMDGCERDDDDAEDRRPSQQQGLCRASTLCVVLESHQPLELLMGISAGRSEEFLALPLRFTLDVMKDTVVMSITPPFLKR